MTKANALSSKEHATLSYCLRCMSHNLVTKRLTSDPIKMGVSISNLQIIGLAALFSHQIIPYFSVSFISALGCIKKLIKLTASP